eukprot:gene7377-5780_t
MDCKVCLLALFAIPGAAPRRAWVEVTQTLGGTPGVAGLRTERSGVEHWNLAVELRPLIPLVAAAENHTQALSGASTILSGGRHGLMFSVARGVPPTAAFKLVFAASLTAAGAP